MLKMFIGRRAARGLEWVAARAPHTVLIAIVSTGCVSLSGCTKRTVLSMNGRTLIFEPTVRAKERDVQDDAQTDEVGDGQARIWFLREKNGNLEPTPVVRSIAGNNAVRDCVEALLYGPTKVEAVTGLATEIPRGTVLIGVTEHDGDIDLNLSRRFSQGGESSMEARVEQLRRTVTDAVHDRKVFLDVEGKRFTAAGGDGLEIKQPINM